MPTGVQLQELITDVRAEAARSLSAAHGQNERETIARRLRRKQATLWQLHDWPLHSSYWDATFEAGERRINYPADLDQTRVNHVAFRDGARWAPLFYGIGPAHLNQYDSDDDERGYPVQRWQHHYVGGLQQGQVGQIELWPIPDVAGTIRLWGHEKLRPLVADEDLCMLDSDMLVLYVAGELLLRDSKADAQLKIAEADTLKRNILGQSSQRQDRVIYGGASRETGRPRDGLEYVTKRAGT